MTSEHTPGPWLVEPASPGFRAPDAKDFAIVAVNKVCPGIVWDFGDEGRANAALIATAPELLVAFKELAAAFPVFGHADQERLNKARAAIAKAEGR